MVCTWASNINLQPIILLLVGLERLKFVYGIGDREGCQGRGPWKGPVDWIMHIGFQFQLQVVVVKPANVA